MNRTGRTLRKSRFRLWFNRNVKTAIMAAIFRCVGVYERGKRNAITPSLRRFEISFPNLPRGLDGFEILQISDLHIDRIPHLNDALLPLIEPLRPDLCVLTGDYRWEVMGSCAGVYPPLRAVLNSIHARHGMIGILGNHDAAEIALYLEEQGVRMLVNESTTLSHNGATLHIAGTDDYFDYQCDDLDAALSGIPRDDFTLLLTHTPDLYREAAAAGVNLYLCGHTHAGQIRVPGIGAIKKNAKVARRFVQDRWTHNGMEGYTSWGTGCSTIPVRYNCPAEATLFRLRRH